MYAKREMLAKKLCLIPDETETRRALTQFRAMSFFRSARSTFNLTASKLFDISAARHLFKKEMTRSNRCDLPFEGAVACIESTRF
jgi:hypothetical protein